MSTVFDHLQQSALCTLVPTPIPTFCQHLTVQNRTLGLQRPTQNEHPLDNSISTRCETMLLTSVSIAVAITCSALPHTAGWQYEACHNDSMTVQQQPGAQVFQPQNLLTGFDLHNNTRPTLVTVLQQPGIEGFQPQNLLPGFDVHTMVQGSPG